MRREKKKDEYKCMCVLKLMLIEMKTMIEIEYIAIGLRLFNVLYKHIA